MISSMDLFLRRDSALGRGPWVDAPRLEVDLEASSGFGVVVFKVGWAVEVVLAPGRLKVGTGCVEEAVL